MKFSDALCVYCLLTKKQKLDKNKKNISFMKSYLLSSFVIVKGNQSEQLSPYFDIQREILQAFAKLNKRNLYYWSIS